MMAYDASNDCSQLLTVSVLLIPSIHDISARHESFTEVAYFRWVRTTLSENSIRFGLILGLSWLRLVTIKLSQVQPGTQLGRFEAFSSLLRNLLNARKPLKDAGLEVVPGGGIEPSTHGFSVCTPEFHNLLKFSKLLDRFGFRVASFLRFLPVLSSFLAVFSHRFSHGRECNYGS